MTSTDQRKLAFLVGLACLAGLVAGCTRDAKSDGPRETIDVPPEIVVETADDPKERYRPPELAGVLPVDFPDDLPVYKPSSLVDFGDGQRGFEVRMMSPDRLAKVRRSLFEQLDARGWTSGPADGGGAGQGESLVLSKDGRRAWLHLEDGRPGTVYRFEY